MPKGALKEHLCRRCGIPVYEYPALCMDCRQVEGFERICSVWLWERGRVPKQASK